MSTLMLLYKGDNGRVFDIPFAYRDGEMMGLAEAVADVIVGLGGVDSLWEAIAADRLRTILEQRAKLKEQRETIESMRDAVGAMAL